MTRTLLQNKYQTVLRKKKTHLRAAYSLMIEVLPFGRVDVAYFGPASYTIAKDKIKGGKLDIAPFAARLKGGSTKYQSVIIANAGASLNKIADMHHKLWRRQQAEFPRCA